VSICISRLGTYMERLDYLVGARSFPNAIVSDERIRTVGDAWQHAIANVMAGPACCATGYPIVVGIAPFTGWKAAKWSFATALPFVPSRRLKGNPAGS
jgi:hypothetical protein